MYLKYPTKILSFYVYENLILQRFNSLAKIYGISDRSVFFDRIFSNI